MKVSCLQENLAKGLSIVGRAVSPRSTLPVLGNVLLATDAGRLKLSATNLEVGINCWIGAKVEEEGSVTVPARTFIDLTNALPPDRVDMELVTRTQTLNLRASRSEANIKGIDAQEFPLVPVPEGEGGISVEANGGVGGDQTNSSGNETEGPGGGGENGRHREVAVDTAVQQHPDEDLPPRREPAWQGAVEGQRGRQREDQCILGFHRAQSCFIFD